MVWFGCRSSQWGPYALESRETRCALRGGNLFMWEAATATALYSTVGRVGEIITIGREFASEMFSLVLFFTSPK